MQVAAKMETDFEAFKKLTMLAGNKPCEKKSVNDVPQLLDLFPDYRRTQ